MAKLFLRRTTTGFEPAGTESEQLVRAFKVGSTYRATINLARNYRHHCLFMALLQLTFDNQDRYTDFKQFRREVARQAGHTEQLITADGEILEIPLSYSYEEIPDETEFTPKFMAAMTVCARMMHDIGLEELEAEVGKYADRHYGVVT